MDKETSKATFSDAYSPLDYMTVTSFPRSTDDGTLSQESHKISKDDALNDQDTDPDDVWRSDRLQRLTSAASDMVNHDLSQLRETHRDPLAEGCAYKRDGITIIITACLTFATGVTVALIMQIYLGNPQIFKQGAVVTDAGPCTTLGFKVLNMQGSSVDAAIAAALCMGIVHPHTSGLGGGGIMLVHDIHKNESRVIDFRETAPSGVEEEMLQSKLEDKPGMLVAVPGMLKGMHQAHQLYGTLQWKNILTLVADVARNGFNVTHDLADSLAKVKDQNTSTAFQDFFIPNGQVPLPGLFRRRVDLATIFDRVAANGISEFYNSNLTQEIVSQVQLHGGVIKDKDFHDYNTLVNQPVETRYHGNQVMTASAPHAGPALLMALNILEGFNITSQISRSETYHWIAESLKIALSQARMLGDPMFDSALSEVMSDMLSKKRAAMFRGMINDSQAAPPGHYGPPNTPEGGTVASQVMVMGPDDFMVSVMSSLNQPFGSRIVTPSGILLNSQILAFSWPNKTESSVASPKPYNYVKPGKRPMSFLMPTAVRPSAGLCGSYVSLGSSNGDRALSGVTQVLMSVLSIRKNLSDSLSYGRLHPLPEANRLLVDTEFLVADVEALDLKGHKVERVEVLSMVQATRRTNDQIIGVNDPRSSDASALTMSMPLP